jgi:hypothetical protein
MKKKNGVIYQVSVLNVEDPLKEQMHLVTAISSWFIAEVLHADGQNYTLYEKVYKRL